jgi:hypothetical protein
VGVGSTSIAKLGVVSSSASLMNIPLWNTAYSIFGPGASSANGACVGLGYDTTLDAGGIIALQPGVAWKQMRYLASTHYFYIQGALETLRIDGAGTTSTAFNATSSRAIKRETGRPSRAADMLSKLRPILYRLLEGDGAEQLGLIAEEVHEVCPQMSNGKTVSYDRLAILLLADWQERHGMLI